jgi:hypothetical protein
VASYVLQSYRGAWLLLKLQEGGATQGSLCLSLELREERKKERKNLSWITFPLFKDLVLEPK